MSKKKTVKAIRYLKRIKTVPFALTVAVGVCLTACGTDDAGEGDSPVSEILLEEIPGDDPVLGLGAELNDDSGAGGQEAEQADGSGADAEKGNADKTASSEEGGVLSPVISWEILRETKKDDAGEELAWAEYPVFTVSGEGYEALSGALEAVNAEYKAQSDEFLAFAEEGAGEEPSVLSQSVSVSINRCDESIVCVTVSRSVEEGGPHPNNYFEAYNLNAGTGEALKLSECMTVDDSLKETIEKQLYENYPEIDFDEALVKQEISDALDQDMVEWYFLEDQICISFQEGSFGLGHAEGSLGAVLSPE